MRKSPEGAGCGPWELRLVAWNMTVPPCCSETLSTVNSSFERTEASTHSQSAQRHYTPSPQWLDPSYLKLQGDRTKSKEK